MQHEVGIRRSHGTRFVLPGSQHRDPRSGPLRVFRTLARVVPASRHPGQLPPVAALRAAGRSPRLPMAPDAWGRARPRAGAMSWAPARRALRDPRSGATPWRG